MKKILALVLVLMSFASAAFAQTDDYATIHEAFKEHSIDDLLLLQKMVEIELEYRGYTSEKTSSGKETTVPVGKYTIGSDIPANTYTIKNKGSVLSMVTIYNEYGGIITMYTITPSAPIGKCELTEGQSIEIIGEPVVFSQYVGLDF